MLANQDRAIFHRAPGHRRTCQQPKRQLLLITGRGLDDNLLGIRGEKHPCIPAIKGSATRVRVELEGNLAANLAGQLAKYFDLVSHDALTTVLEFVIVNKKAEALTEFLFTHTRPLVVVLIGTMIYLIGAIALAALIVACLAKYNHVTFKEEQNALIADLKAQPQRPDAHCREGR